MRSNQRWRVGVLGGGEQADYRGETLRRLRLEGLEWTALAEPREARARQVAVKFGFPRIYAGLEEMITGEERAGQRLDAILNLTPHYLHAKTSIQAMNAGLHVFCEKPMAITRKDCIEMLEAAEAARTPAGRPVCLAIGYQYWYWTKMILDPFRGREGEGEWARIAAEVSESEAPDAKAFLNALIGKSRGAISRWIAADAIPDRKGFHDAPELGVKVDRFGHCYAAARLLFPGHPAWVEATASAKEGKRAKGRGFKAEDTIEPTIGFSSGDMLSNETSWAKRGPTEELMDLHGFGADGNLYIEFPAGSTDVGRFRPVLRRRYGRYGHPGSTSLGPPPPTWQEVSEAQIRDWWYAAVEGKPPSFTPHAAFEIESVRLTAARAAASGRRELVPPA